MHFHPWRVVLPTVVVVTLCLSGAVAAPGRAAEGPAAIDALLGPPFTRRERPSLGPVEAAVILIEISDFRCEHCRQFHERVFPRIRQRYIDTGLIRYIVLSATTPGARPAPEAFALARCALAAGRFWESRTTLFAHAHEPLVSVVAQKAGLDPTASRICLHAPATRAAVASDQAEADKLKVAGTPTFIVRRRLATGGFVEARVDGYESWDYFQELLSDLLQREER